MHITWFFTLSALVLLGPARAVLTAPGGRQGGAAPVTTFTLQSDTLHFVVSTGGGQVMRVVDRVHQRDLFVAADQQPPYGLVTAWFASTGPVAILPQSLLSNTPSVNSTSWMLTATWPKQGFSASIRVQPAGLNGLQFDVVAVAGTADRLNFVSLPFAFQSNCAAIAGGVWDDGFAIVIQPTDAYVVVGGYQGPGGADPCDCNYVVGGNASTHPVARLTGALRAASGLVGHGAVVYAKGASSSCGGSECVLCMIREHEMLYGLPSPNINGEWAVTAPESQEGYLFLSVAPETLNETIRYAIEGGFGYIMMMGGCVATTGHYQADSKWGGMAGLRSAIGKMKASGVSAGYHSMAGMIQPNDAYVTPIPDPRLSWRFGIHNLSSPVSANATWFPSLQSTAGLPQLFGAQVPSQGLAIVIGDEIITYSLAATTPPYGFTITQRGAFGTKPAAHAAGAAMRHLTQDFGYFLPSPTTTLFAEVAANLARFYVDAGFDMIYFDGLDAFSALGTTDFPGSAAAFGLFHQAFWDSLVAANVSRTANVLAESSVYGFDTVSFVSHMNSRAGQTDWAATDPRAWYDFFKATTVNNTRCQALKRADLGWWGYVLWDPAHHATLPDEVGYMATKAAAFSSATCLELDDLTTLQGNGRTAEAFSVLKWWATNAFGLNASVRERLKAPGIDFLVSNRSKSPGFAIVPTKFHSRRVADPGQPASLNWTVPLAFPTTPGTMGVRVRALTALESAPNATTATGIDLLQADQKAFRTNVCSDGAGQYLSFAVVDQQTLELNFTAPDGDPYYVGCFTQQFANGALNLAGHRAFAMEVFGDASDALIDFQIADSGGQLRDYFITVDWSGWRWVTVAVPETQRLFEHRGGAFPYYVLMSMRDFDWPSARGFNIFVTATGAARLRIRTLVALKELEAAVGVGARLTIGTMTVQLPPSLQSRPCPAGQANVTGCADYLECKDIEDVPQSCVMYDANNWPIARGSALSATSQNVPTAVGLRPGTVDVSYASDGQARVEVELIEMSGEQLWW